MEGLINQAEEKLKEINNGEGEDNDE